MKPLWVLAALITLAACAPHSKSVRIDPDFEPQYTTFKAAYEQHTGNALLVNDLIVEWVDGPNEAWEARCLRKKNQTPWVQVNRDKSAKHWASGVDGTHAEQIIFHELGHCLMGRAHTDGQTSIMFIALLDDATYAADRAQWWHELFSH